MAAKPTPGGSSGTWGTELNDFLDVSLETDGTILASSVTADSTTLVGTGTDVQAVFEELDNAIVALQAPTYIVQTASSTLANEQATGALATGILKSTTTTGALTIATGADLPTGIPIASLADPTTGKVIGSAGSAAAAVFPPGYEFGYKQVTTNQTTTATSAATATTWITMDSITFDGSTIVMLEFFCSGLINSTTASTLVNVWEDSTDRGVICQVNVQSTSSAPDVPVCGRFRFTPATAAKVYTIKGWVSSTSTGTAQCGDGATTRVPSFARITKV